MRISDVFGMCVKNLWKRKLRTFLTLLGVIVGTASIILMISLGLAVDEQFAQMIENRNLDMTQISVWPQGGEWQWTPELGSHQINVDVEITDEIADRIQLLPNVIVSTPRMRAQILLRSGPYAAQVWDVMGIRPEAMEHMGFNVEFGRLLQEGDEFAAVFSSHTEKLFFDIGGDTWGSYRLWGEGDPYATYVDIFNDPIRLYYDTDSLWRGRNMGMGDDDDIGMGFEEAFTPVRSFELNVVGALEHIPDPWGWSRGETTIYMDIDTLQTLSQFRAEAARRNQEDGDWMWGGIPSFSAIPIEVRETYDDLMVRVDCMDNTSHVAEIIRDMGFGVSFAGDAIDDMRQQTESIESLLLAIAIISLFVAAINIANTMITSVTERTREIGIMKVIGATISDVRKLFLTEAVVIGLLGGFFGIGLALLGSYAMNNFNIPFLENLNLGVPEWMLAGDETPRISLITPMLCLIALGVSGLVGILSGFYPAWRATRLSALAAIRGD